MVLGYLPALSPPFTNNTTQHAKHLSHLKTLLRDPVVLTSSSLAQPLEVLPLTDALLQKSSLGKPSRAKIRACYLHGEYDAFQTEDKAALERHELATFRAPSTPSEQKIQSVFASLMGINPEEISVTSGLMEMGVPSVEVIKFKALLQEAFAITDIPIIAILTRTIIETLAVAIEGLSTPRSYDPVVALNAEGTKRPLWLVHPGAGEILVYLNLATQITDRPLYALRACGFDHDEKYFQSIPELIDTYYAQIKKVQPGGTVRNPRLLIRVHVRGGTLKRLIASGDEVKFTGVPNLPPHVQYRIRQLNIVTAILTLALFLDLIQDDDPDTFHPDVASAWQAREKETPEVQPSPGPGILRRSGTSWGGLLVGWSCIHTGHVWGGIYHKRRCYYYSSAYIAASAYGTGHTTGA